MERWRKPVVVHNVEENPDEVELVGGEFRHALNVAILAEDADRIRQGYVCLRCLEPHEQPYPANCLVCGYAMRDLQAADYLSQFRGNVHVGPSTTLEAELDRLDEQHDRRMWAKRKGIVLPPMAPSVEIREG